MKISRQSSPVSPSFARFRIYTHTHASTKEFSPIRCPNLRSENIRRIIARLTSPSSPSCPTLEIILCADDFCHSKLKHLYRCGEITQRSPSAYSLESTNSYQEQQKEKENSENERERERESLTLDRKYHSLGQRLIKYAKDE